MPTLIACLSSGKGTWTEVFQLIQSQDWSKVFLITDHFGQEKFSLKHPALSYVLIDTFQDIGTIKKQILQQLQVQDFDVGLNFVSGSGKEHMALLEAVMELGLNFRLVTADQGRVEVLGIERQTT